LAAREQRQDVGFQHGAPLLRVAVDDRGRVRQPGVVDHDVEAPGVRERPLHEILHLPHVAHVERHHGSASAPGLDATLRLVHRRARPPGQVDVRAGAAQLLGDGAADAARCPGDHRGLPCE